jgi:FAD/FMN-containing dehydrogenase
MSDAIVASPSKAKPLGLGLAGIVGAANVFEGDAIEPRYLLTSSSKATGKPGFAVRPGSTEEVAQMVRLAAAHKTPIIPLGGGTSLVEGATATDGAIILSLERLNCIIEVDALGRTMTVEAGATLQAVQERAEENGRFTPLDLGARGSCTLGGNIAINAGGMRVLRWGMMRLRYLGWTRSEPEIALMRVLNAAIDPANLMNPRKVVLMEAATN